MRYILRDQTRYYPPWAPYVDDLPSLSLRGISEQIYECIDMSSPRFGGEWDVNDEGRTKYKYLLVWTKRGTRQARSEKKGTFQNLSEMSSEPRDLFLLFSLTQGLHSPSCRGGCMGLKSRSSPSHSLLNTYVVPG